MCQIVVSNRIAKSRLKSDLCTYHQPLACAATLQEIEEKTKKLICQTSAKKRIKKHFKFLKFFSKKPFFRMLNTIISMDVNCMEPPPHPLSIKQKVPIVYSN